MQEQASPKERHTKQELQELLTGNGAISALEYPDEDQRRATGRVSLHPACKHQKKGDLKVSYEAQSNRMVHRLSLFLSAYIFGKKRRRQMPRRLQHCNRKGIRDRICPETHSAKTLPRELLTINFVLAKAPSDVSIALQHTW